MIISMETFLGRNFANMQAYLVNFDFGQLYTIGMVPTILVNSGT